MKSIPYSRGHSTQCGCPITSSQLAQRYDTGSVTVPACRRQNRGSEGRGDLPRTPSECGWEAAFREKAAKLRKHPKRRGPAPPRRRQPAPTRAGRPKKNLLPGGAASPPPARAGGGSGVPATSAALSRPRRARGRREARATAAREQAARLSARPALAGAVPGDGWGKGPRGRPRVTHASNLLFILSPPLSPLPHGVTSALPGPFVKGPATSG